MRLTVGRKLFVSVFLVSLFTIALITGLTTWSLRQGFSSYLARAELSRQDVLVKRLEDVFAARGNWTLFKDNGDAWRLFLQPERLSEINFDLLNGFGPFFNEDVWSGPDHAKLDGEASPLLVQFVPERPSATPQPRDADRRAPQSALDDCRGRQEGDEVWHRTRDGILRSTCLPSPEGLVARPNRSIQSQGQTQGRQPSSETSPVPANRATTPPPVTSMPRPVVPEKIAEPETAEVIQARRFVLMDQEGRYLAGMRAQATDAVVARPLKYDGKTIGQLGVVVTAASSAMDQSFLDHSIEVVLVVAVGALLLSLLAALALARHFTSILRQVTLGTRRLASGEYATRIAGDRRDEFGELVRDFNRLAHALEQHENNRRLWVAQTSHELRTPIAILRAHVEALLDEVRAPNRQEFEVLHKETLRLGKLVTDLNDLARADSGALAFKKETVELVGLLNETLEVFAARLRARAIRCDMTCDERAFIFGDAGRLRQLFANLFENVLRYTDQGGTLRVTVHCRAPLVEVYFEDSEPGVEPSALASLFDPFFRTEGSRQRETGGSGLGLAICKSIVTAHEGTIEAFPSELGGLKLRITFGLLEGQA